ncbi:retrotransposon protein, putative, ty1-copia subclass [Tanacetum coccineum]
MVLGIAPAAIIDRQLPFEYTITSRSTDVVVMALPVQNINHSAFRSMFEREKLSGTNFNNWFRQLKLVLRVERKLFVIEQPISLASPTDSEYLRSGMRRLILDEGGKPVDTYVILDEDLCGTGHLPGFCALTSALDKQVYIPKPKNPKPSAKEHPAKDDTCHHCKEVGHCKRNCPAYLVELIKKKKQVGTSSSSDVKQVETIGSLDLVLPNGLVICLDNCHYAPSILRGVVSVHRLVENEFVKRFTDFGISVSKNNVHYFNVIPSNGIYEIDMHNLVPNVNSIYNVSTKRAKHNLESTYLWHCRLAHISKKRIEKLQHERLLKSTDDESFDQCVSCH